MRILRMNASSEIRLSSARNSSAQSRIVPAAITLR
jgi:hypothetical protein